ncbi:MAG: glucokinase [Kordiimonas sp.]
MPVSGCKSDGQVLVADIGGTNARLAIATISSVDDVPLLSQFQAFQCAEYHDLDAVLSEYFSNLNGPAPKFACLAVAGPVIGRTAHLTNLGWHLDEGKLESTFGFEKVLLVNDFAANARSTTALSADDLLVLRDCEPAADGPISVMGPGTGFGLALLVRHPGGCSIVSGEGGHISFVPHGDLETRVWSALQQNMGRVTVETLLSGVGLMRIYRELCHIHDVTPLNYDPRTISNQALDHGDKICLETLSVFCSMLGSVVGDIALSHGSTGGIYLAGGILPKISEFFVKSDFVERFLDKPPMQEFVGKVPVHLIIAPDAALRGAALLFREAEKHSTAA